MPRRLRSDGKTHDRLEMSRYRVRRMALALTLSDRLPHAQKEWLMRCLEQIGEGEDAEKAFGFYRIRAPRRDEIRACLSEAARLLKLDAAIPEVERCALVDALTRIAKGEVADLVLEVDVRRGERKSAVERAKPDKLQMAISWIAAAIEVDEPKHPVGDFDGRLVYDDGGLGLSLTAAVQRAADAFGYEYEALMDAWKKKAARRTRDFERPLSSLPDTRSWSRMKKKP